MRKKETDILLIRKYLNGELDARAMHQLERRAQDDPFLMDAIEGYEKVKNDQQLQLNQLSASLQQRITHKESRIIPWRMIAIAASVLVFFTIGGLWIYNSRQPDVPNVALAVKPQVKQSPPATSLAKQSPPAPEPAVQDNKIASLTPPLPKKYAGIARPVIKADKAVTNSSPQADKLANANTGVEEPVNEDSDSTSLSEMVVMDMTKKSKEAAQSKRTDTLKESRIFHQPNINTALAGKVAGVRVSPAEGKPMPGYFDSSLKRRIEGRIIDKMDGMPLPGVSVKVAGTNTGTLTDANGLFKLSVDSNKARLSIGFIGYQSLNVNVNKRDSLKTIAMVPSNNSLNEVVVVGYGIKKTDDEFVVTNAHPKDGWSSFRKYLKENAKSPDGKTGIIKLSFMVDRYGSVSEITIIKGLSPATNQKAIDLVSDGPDWAGNSGGQTGQVTVRIKFIK
jgi:hypothetical protein